MSKFSSKYVAIEQGLYINRELTPEDIRNKLRNMRYAVFDFDYTLYPGMIILEIAQSILSKYAKEGNLLYSKKLMLLSDLVQRSKKMSFPKVADEFIHILKGMACHDFEASIPFFLNKRYPCGSRFIERLASKGVSCYIVSLTADFVARQISKNYSVVTCSSMKYNKFEKDGVYYLSGSFREPLDDTINFKNKQFERFLLSDFNKKNSLMAGDSIDDLGIMSLSGIKIGVNPKELFLSNCDFDVLLKSDGDPWLPLLDYL